MGQLKAMVKQTHDMNQQSSLKVPEVFILDAIKTKGPI
jgi:hypothetical protein